MIELRIGWVAVGLTVGLLTGCGSSNESTAQSRGDCPTVPISVVVTVDQWGDIVEQLGGDCATVVTVIAGSSADPHDYEPTPADTTTFEGADLVILNGLGYDSWARRAIETLDARPNVVDGGEVVGLAEGDNPHLWYGPEYVRRISAAVTAEMKELTPEAAAYLDARQTVWQSSMDPYDEFVERIAATSAGMSYGATEPVFDFMGDAVGLTDATPQGYRNAALNETDPSPADVAEFEDALRSGRISVLIDNTQTEGPTPEQLRGVAEEAGVPVVEVTESIPPGTDSFAAWQVTQLESLAAALGA